jgi:HAMP domain-containing protein
LLKGYVASKIIAGTVSAISNIVIKASMARPLNRRHSIAHNVSDIAISINPTIRP